MTKGLLGAGEASFGSSMRLEVRLCLIHMQGEGRSSRLG